MRKSEINFTIDIAAFLAFVFLISTGFLIYWILPAGSGKLAIWGMTRHDWGNIHFGIAVVFLTLIGVHIVLHWNWIKSMIEGKKNKITKSTLRVVFAIITVLIVIFLALAPFFSPIENIR